MAFQDNTTKSIGLILGIGLVAVIFIIVTALTSNSQKKVDYKIFQEEISKITFNAPQNWSVGKSETSKLQTTSQFISTIRPQSSQCSITSSQISEGVKTAMQGSSSDALNAWKSQYPGIVEAQLYKSTGGLRVLGGIDICEPVLVRKAMYFRGIVYSNNIEVQFTMRYSLDSNLTQSQLRELANNVVKGRADQSQEWDQFSVMLNSVR